MIAEPSALSDDLSHGHLIGIATLAPEATAILACHRPDDWGICTGCEAELGRLVHYPCPPATWAGAVDRRIPSPLPAEGRASQGPMESRAGVTTDVQAAIAGPGLFVGSRA